MRRKAAVFALIASFALLGSTSPAEAAVTRPIGSTRAVEVSPPQNPDLVAILAFVRRERPQPVRVATRWRLGLSRDALR